jgi:hypothetical protein
MAPEWPFISRPQGMQVGSSGRGEDYSMIAKGECRVLSPGLLQGGWSHNR